MEKKSYIIKFRDFKSREHFKKIVLKKRNLEDISFYFPEFLPDVIVSDVSLKSLGKLRKFAGNNARFFEDFEHQLCILE